MKQLKLEALKERLSSYYEEETVSIKLERHKLTVHFTAENWAKQFNRESKDFMSGYKHSFTRDNNIVVVEML